MVGTFFFASVVWAFDTNVAKFVQIGKTQLHEFIFKQIQFNVPKVDIYQKHQEEHEDKGNKLVILSFPYLLQR